MFCLTDIRSRTLRRRPGATTVEFAMVIGIFILFLFGFIDLGRGFMVSHLVTDAAREGCRQGILPGKSNSDVTTRVNDLLSKENIKGATTEIKVNDTVADVSTATSEDEITVSITIPVSSVSWLPVGQILTGSIKGQSSLRHE